MVVLDKQISPLELMDLTLKVGRRDSDGRGPLLEELCRCRELFCEAYLSSDLDTLRWVEHYFGQFARAMSI